MLIVQLCEFGVDGDAQYRVHAPSRALGTLTGVTAIDAHFMHPRVAEWIETADVLVIQFFNDWDLVSLCEQRRRRGKVTVFEANDYFFDLQTWSPIGQAWSDRTLSELYARLLATADGVQTSSAALASRWRQRGARRVAVFANQLEAVAPLPAQPARPFTLGWAGSPGHFADWLAVAPVLAAWLADHRDARLAVMTNALAKDFFDLPPERYRFTDFGSLADYLAFLPGLDVGLAPLLPTDYNRCRSDVKFLEYAAQGVVGLYSDLDPYRASVAPGETGLLYRTPDELVAGLDRLYQDPAYRQRLRNQAYEHVSRRRRLADHVGERLAWYRDLGAPHGDGGPGGYHAMRLSPSQQAVRESLDRAAADPAGARRLVEAELQAQPQHLALLLARGRLCNDMKQPREAMTALTQALGLLPGSAQAQSELARARLLDGDPAAARAGLQAALQTTPDYLPGWQYLLRLNAITHSEDQAAWARQAIRHFPLCYPVVIMAGEALPPDEAARELLELLDRVGGNLSAVERPLALAALRNAVERLLARAPSSAVAESMLRRACALFPESARLAGWHGEVLYRIGEPDQAVRELARAAQLRVAAAVDRDEFGADRALPWTWIFAHHIAQHI